MTTIAVLALVLLSILGLGLVVLSFVGDLLAQARDEEERL